MGEWTQRPERLATMAFLVVLGSSSPASAYPAHTFSVPATCEATGLGVSTAACDFGVTILDETPIVRGIVFEAVGGCATSGVGGGDTRNLGNDVVELVRNHGFAYLGARNNCFASGATVQDAVARLAAASGHPELVDAPFVGMGASAGARTPLDWAQAFPSKAIGLAVGFGYPNWGGGAPGGMPATGRIEDVPLITFAEGVGGAAGGPTTWSLMVHRVLDVRAHHGPWAIVVLDNVGHASGGGPDAWPLPVWVAWLDKAIDLRLPPSANPLCGPVVLAPIVESSGWIVDSAGPRTTSPTPMISPLATFSGDTATMSWVFDQDMAVIVQASSGFDASLGATNPVTMTAPALHLSTPPILRAGSAYDVTADASVFGAWTRLELFEGSRSIGVFTDGVTTTVHLASPSAGHHVYRAVASNGARSEVSQPLAAWVVEAAAPAPPPGCVVMPDAGVTLDAGAPRIDAGAAVASLDAGLPSIDAAFVHTDTAPDHADARDATSPPEDSDVLSSDDAFSPGSALTPDAARGSIRRALRGGCTVTRSSTVNFATASLFALSIVCVIGRRARPARRT